MKSGPSRYFFVLSALLMAGVCVADDAVLPRLLDAPASPPVRRTHYTNPPIPVPASVRLAAAQQRVAIPKEKPQEFRLDLGESFPLAWTFDQVIAATLTSDPRLRIGKEDIRQAKAEYVTSSLIPNPEFSVEGAALPYGRSDHTGIPELNLTFEFPIDWFLFAKRKAEMKSARWEVHQAQAEYADLIRERILETATLFYDVLEAKALLMVAKQDIDLLIQLEEIAKRGVEAGSMPVVELRRISLELLQCRQELLKTEKELDILKTQLRAQFGCTDYDPTFDITGDLDAETDKDPMPLEVAFERARRSRPDIRALRMQINKAKADTVVEKRNAYPEVTAGIGHLQEYEPDPTYRGWGIGVTLTVPLFDRNQGNRMKAHSALAQSNHHYQAGIADLRAEIVEADRNFRIAHQRVHAISTEEIRLATEVRDMMIAAFKVGGRPLVDVLDAERSYRETVRMFITSRADYWRAMYIYKSVVGINSVNDVRAVGH